MNGQIKSKNYKIINALFRIKYDRKSLNKTTNLEKKCEFVRNSSLMQQIVVFSVKDHICMDKCFIQD